MFKIKIVKYIILKSEIKNDTNNYIQLLISRT